MYKHILIPVIFDDGHDTQASFLAAKALADESTKFTVIHVIEAIPPYVVSQIPAEVLAKSRRSIEKSLEQSARALPNAQTELATGHPGVVIVDYAKDHDVDCIVMASHKPGFENLFLGSTADRVVRHARCSVHVIR